MIEISTDIARAVVNLIDLAAPRGAFRGLELTQVGNIRDFIANLINEEREREGISNVSEKLREEVVDVDVDDSE